MKKYAVDIFASKAATVVVDAEDRDEAIVKAGEIAWNLPREEWSDCDDYDIKIYLDEDQFLAEGYVIVNRHGLEFLSYE